MHSYAHSVRPDISHFIFHNGSLTIVFLFFPLKTGPKIEQATVHDYVVQTYSGCAVWKRYKETMDGVRYPIGGMGTGTKPNKLKNYTKLII